MILNEIRLLVRKEIQLEWRQKYAMHGLLLYLASTVFVCYLSFKAKQQAIHPITWNTLFWIILLFIAINAIGKSFTQESAQRNLFYYTIASPEAIIFQNSLQYPRDDRYFLDWHRVLFVGYGQSRGEFSPVFAFADPRGRGVFGHAFDGCRNCGARRKYGNINGRFEFPYYSSFVINVVKSIKKRHGWPKHSRKLG